MDPETSAPGRTRLRWLRRNAAAVLGIVLIVVGVIVLATAPGSDPAANFGWTAYTPLTESAPTSAYQSKLTLVLDGTYVGPQRIIGLIVTVVGLMVLTGALGFRLGTRRTRPSDSAPAG